jgi:serine/threonine-protein kinase
MVPRFKREAQTSAGLSHPHIIQIYTVKETPQLVYFVMKFIEGRSLESVILDKGRVDIHMAQVILSQVASALEYAHRRHVVHRDIKPANIMIDEDGWAVVTDFGIAKVNEAQAQNLTATGTAIGTPHYMSPEQFHNKAVTGASDQYSLGILAYEMLVGKKPFDGATYAEIITQHLFEPPPDLRAQRPDVPEPLAAAVNRMLAKDPAARFPDLEAAAAELGVPHKKEGDVVRTQMISLVKNGPQKKLRMSVPISPIPVTKKAAQTVLEKKGAGGVKTVLEHRQKPKSKMGLLVAGLVVLVLGGGFLGWRMLRPAPTPSQSAAAITPAGSQAPETEPSAPAATPQTETKTPEPTTTAAAASAQVTVTNVPAGAVISLNGRRQASRIFSARPGTYDLRIAAAGFESDTRRITLSAGEQMQIAFDRRERAASVPQQPPTKRAAPSSQGLATLRLILNPPASVSIDGGDKGLLSRVQEELVPGTHTLRITKEGWVTKDTVVTVSAGQTATVRIQLSERRP